MSNYQRLISYIYTYEGGIKGKNTGFAKLETRNGQCRLNVSVKKIFVGGNPLGVYLLAGDEEVKIGTLFARNGAGEFRTVLNAENVEGSEKKLEEFCGLTIHEAENSWRAYTTVWEDAVAHAAEVDLAGVTSEQALKKLKESEGCLSEVNLPISEEIESVGETAVKSDTARETAGKNTESEEREGESGISESEVLLEAGETASEQEISEKAEPEKESDRKGEERVSARELLSGFWLEQREEEVEKNGEEPVGIDTVREKDSSLPGSYGRGIRARVISRSELPAPRRRSRRMVQESVPVRESMRESEDRNVQRSRRIEENTGSRESISTKEWAARLSGGAFPDSENRASNPISSELLEVKELSSEKETKAGQVFIPLCEEDDSCSHQRMWARLRRKYPKILAFDWEDGCEILTIKPQDIGLLPRETWVYGNNSFLLHGYYSFRYLILARLENSRGEPRYLLGVPGHYQSNEQYMASMFGFPDFVLSKKQPSGDESFGYWYTDIRVGD